MRSAATGRPRFIFPRAVMALILREMSTTYGRSPGGYIWALAEPIGGIVLLTAIFALITRSPPLGSNFPLFFATGVIPFMIYQTTSTKVGAAIHYSRQLLAYPSVTYVDAIVARLILNVLTQITVAFILLSVIVVLYGVRLNVDFITCARGILLAVALGVGVGLVNCYMMSMFPIWQFVWAVLNRPLFIVSGIFFLYDGLPAPAREALLWNPVAHPIMLFRRGIYDTYDAYYVSEVYVYLISLILSAFGMLLLYRYHRIMRDEGA
ncbi:ABC transporter permease [Lutimaribacter marinistellae]|uniref:Transport permease protein n=1 Tax=Lutimaribacter marinistellae TaxID=1820329 RepID=A0ABV7TCR7_9RHOB